MIRNSEPARREFRAVVKGSNFMTPDIMEYVWSGDFSIEISRGTGFSEQDIFGVSVVKGAEHRTDLGKMFHSEAGAYKYAASLGARRFHVGAAAGCDCFDCTHRDREGYVR